MPNRPRNINSPAWQERRCRVEAALVGASCVGDAAGRAGTCERNFRYWCRLLGIPTGFPGGWRQRRAAESALAAEAVAPTQAG